MDGCIYSQYVPTSVHVGAGMGVSHLIVHYTVPNTTQQTRFFQGVQTFCEILERSLLISTICDSKLCMAVFHVSQTQTM